MRVLQSLRALFAEYERGWQRRELRKRPWEEEFLHFARDGSVHGHLVPPPDGRRRSVTSDGWCPGWAPERPTR